MSYLYLLTRNLYLMILAGIGAIATWFAMMSTSTCFLVIFYQPRIPASLIKKD